MRMAGVIGGLALLLIAGCGPTSVERTGGSYAVVARPDRILVYDFAVTPDEVKLDGGISARAKQFFEEHQGTSLSAQEIKIGHAVTNAVSIELVKEINGYGLVAERALGWPPPSGKVLQVKGQLVSIDEGNRTERVLIGLGAGRTSVRANVEVYDLTPEGRKLVDSMVADAKSGYKPGMALMMGVGGIAGSLVTSAVVSSVTAAGSEYSWATVDADGKRLAKEVAKNLRQYFVTQGWIAAAS